MASLAQAGVRVKVVGDVAGFPPELQQRIHTAEAATENNQAMAWSTNKFKRKQLYDRYAKRIVRKRRRN